LIIDSKIIKKRREKASHKQLLSFIKKEIESNQKKSRNLNKVPNNALPTNRMEISNKDAVWPRIIEYSKRNFDLVNQISYLYDKYGLLNRTIDGGFTIFVEKNSIPRGLLDEIKRICQVIEENSNKIIKEIDQVLNS
jgi:hypothetical protein